MTLPRHRLEEAAAWNFAVCLDCQGLFEPSAGLPYYEDPPVCPGCASSRILPADLILACADFIEEPEDEQ